jgi:CRISPR-associated protein Csd2
MCRNFYDIRTFGAVMSTEVNCGQVRGPAQLSFARSIDPIVSSEHAITRSSVTKKEDIEKERTMGRKFTIPYALYRAHGTVNPFMADNIDKDGLQLGTGFSEGEGKGKSLDGDGSDLETLFGALEHAFDFDASAARPAGSMAPQGLLIFRHEKPLGNAPAHKLFERLQIESFESRPAEDGKPPRKFSDYAPRITFNSTPIDEFIEPGAEKDLGNGVTLIRRI